MIGGFVYRGDAMPDLRGKYVFGDGVDGRIFYADAGEMRRGDKRLAKVYEFLLLDGAGEQVTMQNLCPLAKIGSPAALGVAQYGQSPGVEMLDGGATCN